MYGAIDLGLGQTWNSGSALICLEPLAKLLPYFPVFLVK